MLRATRRPVRLPSPSPPASASSSQRRPATRSSGLKKALLLPSASTRAKKYPSLATETPSVITPLTPSEASTRRLLPPLNATKFSALPSPSTAVGTSTSSDTKTEMATSCPLAERLPSTPSSTAPHVLPYLITPISGRASSRRHATPAATPPCYLIPPLRKTSAPPSLKLQADEKAFSSRLRSRSASPPLTLPSSYGVSRVFPGSKTPLPDPRPP